MPAASSWTQPGPQRRAMHRSALSSCGFATGVGQQIAAVATARKLAVIVWHVLTDGKPYVWERPALIAHKQRQLQIASGMPAQKGSRKGIAAAYILKAVRDLERA